MVQDRSEDGPAGPTEDIAVEQVAGFLLLNDVPGVNDEEEVGRYVGDGPSTMASSLPA